jgi:hypothetical protein
MSMTEALEMTSTRSRLSSSEVQAFALFFRIRSVRSIFQPTFGFKGGPERSARTRFRGCRFGSLSQSLVSRLPVRLVTINRGQGEHKGRRRVSIGNTLTAEVSLDFIVPKGHSVKVVRLPSFVERRSGELVLRQNINLSKLLLNSLNAPRAIRVLGSAFRAHNGHPADIGSRHDSDRRSLWAIVECFQLLVKNPNQFGARNCFSGHVSFQSDEGLLG